MSWKAIGHSCAGTSHHAKGSGCDDVVHFNIVHDIDDREMLVVCVCDGAGSAKYASMAAEFTSGKIIESLTTLGMSGKKIGEKDILEIMEDVYQGISIVAGLQETAINEYSCTALGALITARQSVLFQIGDGAIVTREGQQEYRVAWWPMQGEYLNNTNFVVDNPDMNDLKIQITDQRITDLAIFTDGLQMLALSTGTQKPHHPFFSDLFGHLNKAVTPEQVSLMQKQLANYLNSDQINSRTDDDKTLFLAVNS